MQNIRQQISPVKCSLSTVTSLPSFIVLEKGSDPVFITPSSASQSLLAATASSAVFFFYFLAVDLGEGSVTTVSPAALLGRFQRRFVCCSFGTGIIFAFSSNRIFSILLLLLGS